MSKALYGDYLPLNVPVHAGPHPLQSVQGVGLQRRDDGSQRREVFAYSTLLLRQIGRHNGGHAWVSHYFTAEAERARAQPYLGDLNPALDDPRPDVRPEPPVLQDCADHAGRHRVELRDGGADGGGAVLAVLLVPLRPDGAQAVVRDHPFKQQLRDRNGLALARPTCWFAPPPTAPPTYCVHVGQLLGHQVSFKGQEVILDLRLYFILLPRAE